ncbi:hypothetical protein HF521_010182 [Silurus meridionalis]|uniref:C-type lectin domain-containing protein n=1 Tax=Silurus meridionalis TaxID=175797 RepID=A0A8T0AJ56_SILME|nr:hypothetical protein HF521_010182 [Silurus meridionalis]
MSRRLFPRLNVRWIAALLAHLQRGENYATEDSSNASKTYILITESKTWEDAQTYCKQYHTDLAVIDNSEDSAAFPVDAAYVWIGLISSYWSDGGFSSFRYWAQDNSESSLDDTCTAMDNSGEWISKQCNLKMSFICYGGES